MSERELNKCKKCHSRHNGNGDMCGICQDNIIELLTLGLLQEKNKVRKLKKGLLEARSIALPGENMAPQAEERKG